MKANSNAIAGGGGAAGSGGDGEQGTVYTTPQEQTKAHAEAGDAGCQHSAVEPQRPVQYAHVATHRADALHVHSVLYGDQEESAPHAQTQPPLHAHGYYPQAPAAAGAGVVVVGEGRGVGEYEGHTRIANVHWAQAAQQHVGTPCMAHRAWAVAGYSLMTLSLMLLVACSIASATDGGIRRAAVAGQCLIQPAATSGCEHADDKFFPAVYGATFSPRVAGAEAPADGAADAVRDAREGELADGFDGDDRDIVDLDSDGSYIFAPRDSPETVTCHVLLVGMSHERADSGWGICKDTAKRWFERVGSRAPAPTLHLAASRAPWRPGLLTAESRSRPPQYRERRPAIVRPCYLPNDLPDSRAYNGKTVCADQRTLDYAVDGFKAVMIIVAAAGGGLGSVLSAFIVLAHRCSKRRTRRLGNITAGYAWPAPPLPGAVVRPAGAAAGPPIAGSPVGPIAGPPLPM